MRTLTSHVVEVGDLPFLQSRFARTYSRNDWCDLFREKDFGAFGSFQDSKVIRL